MNGLLLAKLPTWAILVIVLSVVLILLITLIIVVPVHVWFRALASGAHVSMMRLVGMKLRKVDYKKLVSIYIVSQKAGLKISIGELETHLMAGGNIERVVNALIASHSAKMDLTLEQAKAIDLAGRDVVEAVKTSVTPKVIKTTWIEAMCKNGIQIRAMAQITVRARLDRQIGMADTETILARVGEGIVTAIGKANQHTDILANPSIISKTILEENLDKQTSYEIMSIDICDVDVGENLGAKLKIDEAEAKKKISQAAAEERKAQALALNEEMKAKTQETRAIVLASEAEVHKAMAAALKSGKFGPIEYYKLQNLEADTKMRNAIGQPKEEKPNNGSGTPLNGGRPGGFPGRP